MAAAFTSAPGVATPVDFETDIQPILRANCVQCHGPGEQSAGLRLDHRREAARGGASGLPVLGGTLETNELWRRVSSDDPDFRMPRFDEPLADTQLKLIRRWVEAGTPWRDSGAVGEAEPSVWLQAYTRGIKPALPLILIVFVVALALERLRARPQKITRVAQMTHRVRVAHAVVVAVALIAVHQFIATGRLQAHYDAMLESAHNPFGDPPVPRRPDHASRLRGTYYRGNCERHESLYNGGNYRTCSYFIDLVDVAGRPVDYGDPWPDGGLFVHFELQRAAKTSHHLFQERLMGGLFLTEDVLPEAQTPLDTERTVFLDEVEPMALWSATVPLGPRRSGLIYVYRADVTPDRAATSSVPIAHYAIRYDLHEEDGHLGLDSEIWMGALYVNSRVSPPPMEGRIPFDSWFSERPIPEIEGEPSTDPVLLGEPEHVGERRHEGTEARRH